MELTSKQRAQLRAMANSLNTVVQIGKDGLTGPVIGQVNDTLEARELIKCRVLENSLLDAKQCAATLSVQARAEVVQVIGNVFVLYRQSHDKKKKDKIVLIKSRQK